jgi:hypothetical protein
MEPENAEASTRHPNDSVMQDSTATTTPIVYYSLDANVIQNVLMHNIWSRLLRHHGDHSSGCWSGSDKGDIFREVSGHE